MRPFTVTVSDASGGAKDSKAVVLDYYGRPEVAIQVVVSGTVNYTVQQTLDNPLESGAPITWFDCTDTGLVGQTASKIGASNCLRSPFGSGLIAAQDLLR